MAAGAAQHRCQCAFNSGPALRIGEAPKNRLTEINANLFGVYDIVYHQFSSSWGRPGQLRHVSAIHNPKIAITVATIHAVPVEGF